MCLLLDGYYMQRAQFVFGAMRERGWATFAGEYAFLTQITHTLQTLLFAALLVFDLFNLFIGDDRRRKKRQQQMNGNGGQPRDKQNSLYFINLIGDHGFSLLTVFTAVVGILSSTFFFSNVKYPTTLCNLIIIFFRIRRIFLGPLFH